MKITLAAETRIASVMRPYHKSNIGNVSIFRPKSLLLLRLMSMLDKKHINLQLSAV